MKNKIIKLFIDQMLTIIARSANAKSQSTKIVQ